MLSKNIVGTKGGGLQGFPVGHAGHDEGRLHARFQPHADIRFQTVADEDAVRGFQSHHLQGHLDGDGRGFAHDDFHLFEGHRLQGGDDAGAVGKLPPSTGQVRSGLVAMKWAPFLMAWKAMLYFR